MKMLARVALMSSLAAFAVFGQPPAAQQVRNIPDYILYESFFRRVTSLEDFANRLEAKGNDSKALRAKIRSDAKLTLREEQAVKAAAADWKARVAANTAAAGPLIEAGRAQVKSSGAPLPSLLQQLNELQAQREQIAAGEITQLQTAFGAARFASLDRFVRDTATVKRAQTATPRNPKK